MIGTALGKGMQGTLIIFVLFHDFTERSTHQHAKMC